MYNLRMYRNKSTCRYYQGRQHSLLYHRDTPSTLTQRISTIAVPTTSSQPNTTASTSLKSTREVGASFTGPISHHPPKSTTSNSSSRQCSTLGQPQHQFLIKARALIDPGSELSFISERTVNLLHVKRKQASISISEIGAVSSGCTRGRVYITLRSTYSNLSTISVQCYILPQFTSGLSSTTLLRSPWPQINQGQPRRPHLL